MNSIRNKIALITGASAGIGRAVAESFAGEGARIIIAARRAKRLESLAKRLDRKYGARSFILEFDVRDQGQVERQLGALPKGWKNIEILINNAGLSRGLDKLHEGGLIDWEEMIDTNVKGLLYVSRVVIPGMVKRGRGHIVNIGSIAGHEVYPRGNVYCATKHAVDAITRGMQMDLVETPIRVSTVDPGLVETEFSIVRFRGDKSKARPVYQGLRTLRAKDVAEAVLFCCTRPAHVNIHQLRIMPTNQAASVIIHRE